MLLRIRREPDPVDNPVANATTPDRMIAAAIAESLRTEFDRWEATSLSTGWDKRLQYAPTRKLYNAKKGLRVEWENVSKTSSGSYSFKDFKLDPTKAKVNGIALDAKSSRIIIEAYDRISVVHFKAQEVANKALRDMQINEEKWQMAERLLGMKRNKMGALVPIKTVGQDT